MNKTNTEESISYTGYREKNCGGEGLMKRDLREMIGN